jgi:hypothetical protein
MQAIKDAIELVSNCLSSELAWTQAPSLKKRDEQVLFCLSNSNKSLKYACDLRPEEPKAVAIARRLLAGRLDLDRIAEELNPELVNSLRKIEELSRDESLQTILDKSMFNEAVWSIYGKNIDVYVLDERKALINKVIKHHPWGHPREINKLDRLGYYQHVGTYAMLDQLNHRDTYRIALEKAYANKELQQIPNSTKLRRPSWADVIKVDGMAYCREGRKLKKFVGLYDPKILIAQLAFSGPSFN